LFVTQRRRTRLRGYDYAATEAYFVTVCAARRGSVFGDVSNACVELDDLGLCVASCLWAIPDHHCAAVDTAVVMPDHVHAVILLEKGGERATLSVVVGTFKASVTRASGRKGLWQRSFYDHIVRDEEDLDRVREYIVTNPLRWSLRHGRSGRIYPAPTQTKCDCRKAVLEPRSVRRFS